MPALLQSLLSVPSSNHLSYTLIQSSFLMIKRSHFPPIMFEANHNAFTLRAVSPVFYYPSSSRVHPVRALYLDVDVKETVDVFNSDKLKMDVEMRTSNEEAHMNAYYDSLVGLHNEDYKENERRRKIGLANKGKVPWNKGKKHSAETRVRIKQRTIEALRNPKVRKRMAEHPRAHSDESKAKIGSSLRQIWAKRLRWKRFGEKLFHSWSESIASAAKEGWTDQKELDWDSYNQIKQEMAIQQIRLAEEKAKVKEMAKIMAEKAAIERAAKAAQAKAEEMARLAEKVKEREKRAKARRKTKKKASRRAGEVLVSQELKLKQRLTKIHRKKSTNGPITNSGNMVISRVPALDGLDISLIKKEQLWREVSLADQIKAAKNRKAEGMAKEGFAPTSCVYPISLRSEG